MYKYYEEDIFNPNTFNPISEKDFNICVTNHIEIYTRTHDKKINTIFIDKNTGLKFKRIRR